MFESFRRSVRRSLPRPSESPGTVRAITFPSEQGSRTPRNRKRSSLRYHDDPSHSDTSDETSTPHIAQKQGYRRRRSSIDDDEDVEEQESNEDIEDEDDSQLDEDEEDTPLLPIFSSDHLDILPVFAFTHAFRLMVISRCDTVLSWDQLRSPQVSQFLLKPIQEEIKNEYLNAATVCALLANCLQFTKEANVSPDNSGTNKTRAMICELLAIKMLREYTARELIDALSYNFDPMQGQNETDVSPTAGRAFARKSSPKAARISSLEIALRAQSKRFLAHPVVVQHLEAIWKGSVVFHAAADNLHRRQARQNDIRTYGTSGSSQPRRDSFPGYQKSVTLYNPRDASLFKLSRLRVPRYRNILSTISFAVLLCLFLAVLKEKSLEITTLEVIFWIWTAGYMLDEVLGFNEQGFSLYLASFWNTFDVGILILLIIHLCFRLAGIVTTDEEATIIMAKRAYDVLAASAILLFPRLFSVLDHYRYFSQLIIAFRMMAADMLAIFALIIVFCSGFLVALTLAFAKGHNKTDDPWDVAYALLQMVLGFTPAAWDRWDDYNMLGKTTLALFLFICHFVVVTILITVLTNSFMEIVRNSHEEHQYLFALNTIASVKSDALFAYIPPGNVLQWILTPLRYVLPFRTYIKTNRTIIKVTHFPVLLCIYIYEKVVLQPSIVDRIDVVLPRSRAKKQSARSFPRLYRRTSIATFKQEAALEEVFKQPAEVALRSATIKDGRTTSNKVNNWMVDMGNEEAEPPQDDDQRVVDGLERRRRPGNRRFASSRLREFSNPGRALSVLSDPNDFTSHMSGLSPRGFLLPPAQTTPSALDLPAQQTDADGDDELLTNDNDDNDTNFDRSDYNPNLANKPETGSLRRDYFTERLRSQPTTPRRTDDEGSASLRRSAVQSSRGSESPRPPSRKERPTRNHMRNVSAATMIYAPPAESDREEKPIVEENISTTPKQMSPETSVKSESQLLGGKGNMNPSGKHTPKRQAPMKPRPDIVGKENPMFRSTPDVANLIKKNRSRGVSPSKRRSSLEMDLISDIGDNKAIGGGYVGALPASLAAQMRKSQEQQHHQRQENEMMGRLVMARMNTLEENMREIVHELRENTRQTGSRQRSPERQSQINIYRASKDRVSRVNKSGPVSSAASTAASQEIRPTTAIRPMNDADRRLMEEINRIENYNRPERDDTIPETGPTDSRQENQRPPRFDSYRSERIPDDVNLVELAKESEDVDKEEQESPTKDQKTGSDEDASQVKK